ncbi:MAG: hypothetical protein RR396_06170 [Clostridiales bacterium]
MIEKKKKIIPKNTVAPQKDCADDSPDKAPCICPIRDNCCRMRFCRVLPGDDLLAISQRTGIAPGVLVVRNKLDLKPLEEGMFLIIPAED